MIQEEFDYWREITARSSCRWQEDTITILNGRDALYYMGGESGAFIRISPEGMLQMGTYKEAILDVGISDDLEDIVRFVNKNEVR